MTLERPHRARAPWRLIVDPSRDGAWNLAVDEALLQAYEEADEAGEPSRPPTLRLYGWSPAAVSLGRSQAAAGAHDPAVLAREGIDLVRRPTGGAAVLHEHERTYAVIGLVRGGDFPGGVVDTYRRVAEAIVAGLARLGIAAAAELAPRRRSAPGSVVCFESLGPHEISAGGRKLVGAAQLRRKRAFLQHGSIPLRLDASRLGAVLGTPADPETFTDVLSAAARTVDAAALDAALVAGFEEAFDVAMSEGALHREEALRAAELRCWKYDSMAWTMTGRIGERERRWGPALTR
jgi:lipoyl(octanoyl) transferase